MDLDKKEKINRFLSDAVMSSSVYEVLLDSFLDTEKYKNDVQLLAASRIAIDLLQEGWKDLQKYKKQAEAIKSELKQVGL